MDTLHPPVTQDDGWSSYFFTLPSSSCLFPNLLRPYPIISPRSISLQPSDATLKAAESSQHLLPFEAALIIIISA